MLSTALPRPIVDIVEKGQAKWFGHVIRMEYDSDTQIEQDINKILKSKTKRKKKNNRLVAFEG